MIVLIFLKHNSLCGRLVDSNYFYTEQSIPWTNFCVHIKPSVCMLFARSLLHSICEGLSQHFLQMEYHNELLFQKFSLIFLTPLFPLAPSFVVATYIPPTFTMATVTCASKLFLLPRFMLCNFYVYDIITKFGEWPILHS